jgi:hypothetical protein
MTARGQNDNPPRSGLCQLSPTADIILEKASTDQATRTFKPFYQLLERLFSGSNEFVNGHVPVLLRQLNDGSSVRCGAVPFR